MSEVKIIEGVIRNAFYRPNLRKENSNIYFGENVGEDTDKIGYEIDEVKKQIIVKKYV